MQKLRGAKSNLGKERKNKVRRRGVGDVARLAEFLGADIKPWIRIL